MSASGHIIQLIGGGCFYARTTPPLPALRGRIATDMPSGTTPCPHLPTFAACHRTGLRSSARTASRPESTLYGWTSYFVSRPLSTPPAMPFRPPQLPQYSPLYYNPRPQNQRCRRTCRPGTRRFRCTGWCICPGRRTACTQASHSTTPCSLCCKNRCLWGRTRHAVARDPHGNPVSELA
jgi:hypothetical protein